MQSIAVYNFTVIVTAFRLFFILLTIKKINTFKFEHRLAKTMKTKFIPSKKKTSVIYKPSAIPFTSFWAVHSGILSMCVSVCLNFVWKCIDVRRLHISFLICVINAVFFFTIYFSVYIIQSYFLEDSANH